MTYILEQQVLPLFETHRGDWLDAARHVALELGAGGREVTIDDVRRRMPPPEHVDPRVMGAVFTPKTWESVGYRRSSRTTCHKRPIAVFKLRWRA